jgi:hypothetical protein
MECPVVLHAEGRALARARSCNISDGGMLVEMSDQLQPLTLPERLKVNLSLPRCTASSFMFEPVTAEAVTLRKTVGGPCRLALRFDPPLDLAIEV